MANGQYIIPAAFQEPAAPEPQPQPEPSYEAQQAAAFSARLDAQQYTPETQPAAFQFIKDIENRLDSYRYTAIEIEEAKRPWLKSMKSLILSPKPLMAEFIEKESKIGGRLLQKQDSKHELRFWSEGHEWFFGWTDGKAVSIADSAVHYQVSPTNIQKSYQGGVVPFTPGEGAHFVNAVQAYEHAVRHELYPVDDTLVDLYTADDDNKIEVSTADKDDYRLAA